MMPVPRARVLCVDDDVHVLAALRRQLRDRYEIVLAEGAAEGIARMLNDGPFAAVLSDLHMPGVDGLRFLARVRALDPSVATVLLTGGAEVDAARCFEADGARMLHVAKPCAPELLRAVLHQVLAAEHEDPHQ